MGKKHLIGNQHNLPWDLGDSLGCAFEDNIYTIITNELSVYFRLGLRIEQTPRSNDGGKDIVITSPVNIKSLLGIPIHKHGKDSITIHIECKSTNYPNLRFEKIIPSAVKNKREKIDYFILITNSEILPYTYHLIKEELGDNIEFILIDQYLLAKALKNKYDSLFYNIPLYENENDDFYGEYQIISVGDDFENRYEIYFLFRNYGTSVQSCSLNLVSDINWIIDNDGIRFMVDPNKGYSRMLCVASEFRGGLDTLAFRITRNNNESFIFVDGTKLNEYFEPPYIGKQHEDIKEKIKNDINSNTDNRLYCIWGDSGVGKTRIIHELIKDIRGTNFNIFRCSLKYDNNNSVAKIFKFLREKNLTEESDSRIDLLSYVIKNSKNNYLNNLIIIDDFHYAQKELIDEIKKLAAHKKRIYIIIAGRTDYGFGNLDYLHFVNWAEYNLSDNCFHEVKPLEPDDTIRLIKSIINNIPDSALSVLLKKSMNNPLYIIQYVEYLIGEELVYIRNKNTVAIEDVSSFSSKKYIPKGIEQIYKCRINHLTKNGNNTNNYIEFLYILSVYEGEIKKNTALKLFDEQFEIIPYLETNGFIIFENDSYKFVHESLLLYIKQQIKNNNRIKQKIASIIISKLNYSDCDLSDFSIGRLYLWNKQVSDAKIKFQPLIELIKGYQGLSNIDIDITIYDFLYDVYEVFKKDSKYIEEIKSILNIRIYITLHHMIPYNAVEECDYCLKLAAKTKVLKDDIKFISSILSQKAHALLNSGKNTDGSLVLHKLQSIWIKSNNSLDNKTIFDVADRLSAIYIKFNCHDIAENYNNISIAIANDSKLYTNLAISYRTRSKLFYLNDYQKCKDALINVDKIIENYPSPRIQLNNSIYHAILDFSYNMFPSFDEIINNVVLLNQYALNSGFNRAIIQSLMLLSAVFLKRGNSEDLNEAKEKAIAAIDYSVKFGIPSYMWQLYNLLAIISAKQQISVDETRKYFETVYAILQQQGLLYLGYKNICYSNILAISNIGFFWSRHNSERLFIEKFTKIQYYGKDNMSGYYDLITKEVGDKQVLEFYKKAKSSKVLFSNAYQNDFLKDEETGYFIALT